MKAILCVTTLLVALTSGCATTVQSTNNPNEPKVIKVVWLKVDNPWQHCGHAAQACSQLKGDTLYVWTRLPRTGDDIELQAELGDHVWKAVEPEAKRTDTELKVDVGHEVWHGFEPHFHPHRVVWTKQ